MIKKRVLFLINHFQFSDGAAAALLNLVNNLDPEKFDITIRPLFRCDMQFAANVRQGVKVQPCFGFYFRGFNRIVKLFNPAHWYHKFVTENYDIEIAFQCDLPTRMIGASDNQHAVHVMWMHGWELYPVEYGKADQVVCVSKYNAERTRSEMHGNVNVNHCYNLLDDKAITQKSKESIPSEYDFSEWTKPLFVTVGRLSPEKGYVRLIRIMKELRDEGYTFSLVIVGGGPEEVAIKSAVAEFRLSENVFMTGARNNPHNITVQADCFICSSFSEGYSTVCTEAAILGVPVITTEVPGGAEIIETCGCGRLTGIDDESLKNGIRQVLQNPELLDQWKATLAETKSRFGLQNRIAEMNSLFDTIYTRAVEKN